MKIVKPALPLIAGVLWLTSAAVVAELGVTTSERPWLTEDEFQANPTLHATGDQPVVLHLEAKGAIRRNTFRFLVEESGDFSLCIPADEPHIVRIKLKGPGLKGKGNNRTRLVVRGNACKQVALTPGSYIVEVFHNGRTIPGEGKTAFFHQPEKTRLLGDLQAGVGKPDFLAFRAPNGKFVGATGSMDTDSVAKAIASDVSPNEVWYLLDPSTNVSSASTADLSVTSVTTYFLWPASEQFAVLFTIEDPREQCTSSDIFVGSIGTCAFLPSALHINDQGDGKFDLVVETIFSGVYTDGNETLVYNSNQRRTGETLTLEYKGFECDATPCDDTTPPLTKGEVALYAQCDYKGPAVIFNSDAADMSIYDKAAAAGVGIGNDMVSSIRVGQDTLAFLYEESNFGGDFTPIGTDIPCLGEITIAENTTSSMQVKFADEYIVSTNGCKSCVLSGIDVLGGEDFTGSDFSWSILDGADLSNTIFKNATLEATHFSSARLSGTDFSSANLSCTQFNNADITAATFQDNIVVEDFSCNLNLSGATLNYTSFPQEKWRYFDLSGTIMDNVPAVLSSADMPLDLAGALLSNVTWLAGKQLDNVNLGCYPVESNQMTVCPTPSGTSHCSTLQGTVLTRASLKDACLQEASMEGAFLSFSNFDGADMSGAQLQAKQGGKVTTLEGAFLRGVDLSQANLTGVNASNINFYSASGAMATATNITAPGANFSGAYLAGADFSGQQSNLESTNWSGAWLLGTNFSQVNLSINTSGGVNQGTNSTFNGAYMHGALLTDAMLDDVDFTNTYWDALGAGGELNVLIPVQNLEFSGYWKDLAIPECPPPLMWASGNPPPMNATNADNTCPNGKPGPCDTVWGDDPLQPIENSTPFKSAVPPLFPQDPGAALENQCSDSFSDPNPFDLCWTITSNPPPPQCLGSN